MLPAHACDCDLVGPSAWVGLWTVLAVGDPGLICAECFSQHLCTGNRHTFTSQSCTSINQLHISSILLGVSKDLLDFVRAAHAAGQVTHSMLHTAPSPVSRPSRAHRQSNPRGCSQLASPPVAQQLQSLTLLRPPRPRSHGQGACVHPE